jgi:hypothetical protein
MLLRIALAVYDRTEATPEPEQAPKPKRRTRKS